MIAAVVRFLVRYGLPQVGSLRQIRVNLYRRMPQRLYRKDVLRGTFISTKTALSDRPSSFHISFCTNTRDKPTWALTILTGLRFLCKYHKQFSGWYGAQLRANALPEAVLGIACTIERAWNVIESRKGGWHPVPYGCTSTEVRPICFKAPHSRSSTPHPETDLSKNQNACW